MANSVGPDGRAVSSGLTLLAQVVWFGLKGWTQKQQKALNLIELLNSADDKLVIFFLFFPENRI